MKPSIRTYLCSDDDKRFFGEGPFKLLLAVEETGSLRSAAMSMNMAYTKALRIIRDAESYLGFLLTVRTTGGKGGGGSRLTDEAKDFLLRYEQYRAECTDSAIHIYERVFKQTQRSFEQMTEAEHKKNGKMACIIMASGLGKRFGSNKLMTPFCGKPLIGSVVDTIKSVSFFDEVLVLTRSQEVKNYCDQVGTKVLIHDLPNRNEAVSLGLGHLLEKMPDLTGCLFALGDQPLLKSNTVERMCMRFNEIKLDSWKSSPIIQACCIKMEKSSDSAASVTVGSPILFDSKFFDELFHLPEKSGGSYVLRNHHEHVRYVAADSPMELTDIDTPDDLENLKHFIEHKGDN